MRRPAPRNGLRDAVPAQQRSAMPHRPAARTAGPAASRRCRLRARGAPRAADRRGRRDPQGRSARRNRGADGPGGGGVRLRRQHEAGRSVDRREGRISNRRHRDRERVARQRSERRQRRRIEDSRRGMQYHHAQPVTGSPPRPRQRHGGRPIPRRKECRRWRASSRAAAASKSTATRAMRRSASWSAGAQLRSRAAATSAAPDCGSEFAHAQCVGQGLER